MATHPKEQVRNETFNKKIPTRLFHEQSTVDNPYIAENLSICGYEAADLIQQTDFSDSIFLLLTEELPSPTQKKLFNQLLQLPLLLGPRYLPYRAAMNAGIGKTKVQHILPIGLQVASGEHLGSVEIQHTIRFIHEHYPQSIEEVVKTHQTGEIPGFGPEYPISSRSLINTVNLWVNETTPYLAWVLALHRALPTELDCLLPAAFAATCLDLSLNEKQAVALFQLAIAPSIIALGIEKSGAALTTMPFIKDKDYVIDDS